MTGNTSPVASVLGATTTTAASATLLANTGNPIFQSILVASIIISVALLVTRIVKTSIK